MFNRTRLQLTIRNAAVLSVILVTLNVFVYWIMKEMLFSQIDRSLAAADGGAAASVIQAVPGEPVRTVQMRSSLVFMGLLMDRPRIQLYWTEDLELIPTPGSEAFMEKRLQERLKPTRFGDKPETVKLDGQYFRTLVVQPKSLGITLGDEIAYVVKYQQMLINVSAEIGMLNRLRNILLIGGLIGLLVAVAAGFYLANRALIPIRRAMESQQQFVSDASHELRTPLSVIQAHAELMLRHPDHTIRQDSPHISTVLQEARRMSKLVDGLLTLARSDGGRLDLDIKPVRLDRIVEDAVHKMRTLAEVKQIDLKTEIEGPIPMRADEERLQQLLVILLDNAIKYTPAGGLVRVRCRKAAHAAQLSVEDTGVGIAPEHLPRIFDRFYRGDKARTRREGGTGLGLAIAKWITERHGGKIAAESEPSRGTRISVVLPM
jgi:Signal transduction histidine kinase